MQHHLIATGPIHKFLQHTLGLNHAAGNAAIIAVMFLVLIAVAVMSVRKLFA